MIAMNTENNICIDIVKDRRIITPIVHVNKIKRMLVEENLELLTDCVVTLVIKDGKTLIGRRSDGQGWSSSGGAVESNEGIEQAARRELEEEFGIKATKLTFMGRHWAYSYLKGKEKIIIYPAVFVCTEFEGIEKKNTVEMSDIMWLELDKLDSVYIFEANRTVYEGLGLLNGG